MTTLRVLSIIGLVLCVFMLAIVFIFDKPLESAVVLVGALITSFYFMAFSITVLVQVNKIKNIIAITEGVIYNKYFMK